MRPDNLNTKIFVDSGDPEETKEVMTLLGFLDGQTTNPSLVAKNPDAVARIEEGEKFSIDEVYEFYEQVIKEISVQIPQGSVSVEVYADHDTTVDAMVAQAKEMNSWIPNAHIKLPTTTAGLETASKLIAAGMRVNMTLVFTQEQAAAVYAATKGAKKGDVFLSPFVGRLDDLGQNGMSLIENILKMYEAGDGHVETLVASVRSYDHFLASLKMRADLITAPKKILEEWASKDMEIPADDYVYKTDLTPIAYKELDLKKDWKNLDISHALTTKGIDRFVEDWNGMIA